MKKGGRLTGKRCADPDNIHPLKGRGRLTAFFHLSTTITRFVKTPFFVWILTK